MTDLKVLAEKHYDYMVEMRRHFHRYPELSTQEKEKAATVHSLTLQKTQSNLPVR